jgi:hypothetical protein
VGAIEGEKKERKRGGRKRERYKKERMRGG